MKKIFLFLTFAFVLSAPFPVFSQDSPDQVKEEVLKASEVEPLVINFNTPVKVVNSAGDTLQGPFIDLLEDLFKIDIPDTMDPNNSASYVNLYLALSIPLVPIFLYLISLLLPGVSRKDLIARALVAGVVVIVAIIAFKGEFNAVSLFSGIVALISQAAFYKDILKPAGIESKKTYTN